MDDFLQISEKRLVAIHYTILQDNYHNNRFSVFKCLFFRVLDKIKLRNCFPLCIIAQKFSGNFEYVLVTMI